MAASGLTPESNTNGYTKVLCIICNNTLQSIGPTTITCGQCGDYINYGGCTVVPQLEDQSLIERWQHLADLADFALAMKVTLNNLNKQSFNNFMLRIGSYMSM